MSDNFSGELWHGITGIYEAILAHPFLTGLTDGSLPHDAFAFYVDRRTPCTCSGTPARWQRWPAGHRIPRERRCSRATRQR